MKLDQIPVLKDIQEADPLFLVNVYIDCFKQMYSFNSYSERIVLFFFLCVLIILG